MIKNKLILATSNPGKISDYYELFAPYPIKVMPQSEFNVIEIEETGTTFVENALLKARNASKLTGFPALGDDSGIVVDALDGQPGLYSARYAGPNATAADNIQKLLDALSHVPEADRKARLYTVLVLVRYAHDPAPLICDGTWEGEILLQPRGEQGFGYLPIFYSLEHQRGAAELNIQERTLSSHRGKAFRTLLEQYLKKPL